ncbi:MAG: hypothetical protein HKN14_11300 [Marinicaulis sp.]|nr:hypothetical protein [Marinicaulis sp.]
MAQAGWLRNRPFDTTFIVGVATIAIAAGFAAAFYPPAFVPLLVADMWLIGYQHVIATFTRLKDYEDKTERRFMLYALPILVAGFVGIVAWQIGVIAIVTIYLYWQWFHYTRQSWGISQAYRHKSGGLVKEDANLSTLTFYALPAFGILHRSWQNPDTFLTLPVYTPPTPGWLVVLAGTVAVATLLWWAYQRILAWRAGVLPVAHTLYMVSHFAIFTTGYLLIEDITYGWLAINIWHNAQYILFVWLFNNNRFSKNPNGTVLSWLSQTNRAPVYFFVCVAIATIVYSSIAISTHELAVVGLPIAILVYQAINFHHYIVDSRIWKTRTKTMQTTLNLKRA